MDLNLIWVTSPISHYTGCIKKKYTLKQSYVPDIIWSINRLLLHSSVEEPFGIYHMQNHWPVTANYQTKGTHAKSAEISIVQAMEWHFLGGLQYKTCNSHSQWHFYLLNNLPRQSHSQLNCFVFIMSSMVSYTNLCMSTHCKHCSPRRSLTQR